MIWWWVKLLAMLELSTSGRGKFLVEAAVCIVAAIHNQHPAVVEAHVMAPVLKPLLVFAGRTRRTTGWSGNHVMTGAVCEWQ